MTQPVRVEHCAEGDKPDAHRHAVQEEERRQFGVVDPARDGLHAQQHTLAAGNYKLAWLDVSGSYRRANMERGKKALKGRGNRGKME